MSNLNPQTVLSVHHWTDTLFSFTCTRDAAFRFQNGQFTMVGLEVDSKPLLRAYSLASANYEEHLEFITEHLPEHEHPGELIQEKLVYYPTVTREEFANRGRITDLIETKKLFADLDVAPFSVENDRVMLCGSPHMLRDTRQLLDDMGFQEGSNNHPGHYVVEKAFVG